MSDYLHDHEIPYREWVNTRAKDPGPIPQMDITTPKGVREWLGHPSNWVDTWLIVIAWHGDVPRISRHHAWKMAPDCPEGDGLVEQVILGPRRYRPVISEPEGDPE